MALKNDFSQRFKMRLSHANRMEGRRYRLRAAEERELYMQHFFTHWVLMRLHIISRKGIYKRIRGIFAMGRISGFTKEKCVNHSLSPKYEGRVIQRTSGERSVWTKIRCSPRVWCHSPWGRVHQLKEFKIFLAS